MSVRISGFPEAGSVPGRSKRGFMQVRKGQMNGEGVENGAGVDAVRIR